MAASMPSMFAILSARKIFCRLSVYSTALILISSALLWLLYICVFFTTPRPTENKAIPSSVKPAVSCFFFFLSWKSLESFCAIQKRLWERRKGTTRLVRLLFSVLKCAISQKTTELLKHVLFLVVYLSCSIFEFTFINITVLLFTICVCN